MIVEMNDEDQEASIDNQNDEISFHNEMIN